MTTTAKSAIKSLKIVPNKATGKSSIAAAKEAKMGLKPEVAEQPQQAAPVKKPAAQTKPAQKAATKAASAPKVGNADEMVTLQLPAETRESADGRWVITPVHKTRERWFDTNKPSVSAKLVKGRWHVTLPRGEAAHRQCLEFAIN